MIRHPPRSTLFPYTTLFRSGCSSPLAAVRQSVDGAHSRLLRPPKKTAVCAIYRSEEHTSELQSQFHLVCRLLLEKKKSPALADPPLIKPSAKDMSTE